jgi:hypothetical protein
MTKEFSEWEASNSVIAVSSYVGANYDHKLELLRMMRNRS